MWPLYVAASHYQPSSDDAAGACALYGCRETCADGMACVGGACVAACGPCAHGERCVDGACPPERAGGCATTSDCPLGSDCRDGSCVERGGLVDDPCATDDECRTSTCSDSGYCAAPCAEGACAVGYLCTPSESGEPYCQPQAGVFGDACASPTDCASGLCLTNAAAIGDTTCTRQCSASMPCPAGSACEATDGTEVCVPVRGGCGVAPGAAPPGAAFLLLLVMHVRR